VLNRWELLNCLCSKETIFNCVYFVNVILKSVIKELLNLCAEERGMLAAVARKHIVMKMILLSP
jgi:hypothetical protein